MVDPGNNHPTLWLAADKLLRRQASDFAAPEAGGLRMTVEGEIHPAFLEEGWDEIHET